MDNTNSSSKAAELQAGFYGKLPAHGDFVSRELPTGFVQPWDQWLQQSINGSRALLEEQWLDIYLTSPIWHFAFSPGLLDEHAWLGIMSPSVDSVGRYFSFCIAMKLPAMACTVASFYSSTTWFNALETLVVSALENRLDAESIKDSLRPLRATSVARPPGSSSSFVPLQNGATDDKLDGAAIMLDYLVAEKHPRFSYWRTNGSPLVSPCTRLNPDLPDAELFTLMMNSAWQKSGIK